MTNRLNMTASIQPFSGATELNPTYTAISANTGIQWSNTGREVVAVINGATPSTYSINVGTQIEGENVAAKTGNLPTSNTAPVFFGPFPRDYDQPDGLSSIFFDVGTSTSVTVAILQMEGVN